LTSAHDDHERHYIAAVEFLHVIFPHWLASAMTLVGGFLFASTYRKRTLAGTLVRPVSIDNPSSDT
jgi:hypothetical protein